MLPRCQVVRLCEAAQQRGPLLWSGTFILHHNNAPGHDMLHEQEFLATKEITKLDHPPYSPDLDTM